MSGAGYFQGYESHGNLDVHMADQLLAVPPEMVDIENECEAVLSAYRELRLKMENVRFQLAPDMLQSLISLAKKLEARIDEEHFDQRAVRVMTRMRDFMRQIEKQLASLNLPSGASLPEHHSGISGSDSPSNGNYGPTEVRGTDGPPASDGAMPVKRTIEDSVHVARPVKRLCKQWTPPHDPAKQHFSAYVLNRMVLDVAPSPPNSKQNGLKTTTGNWKIPFLNEEYSKSFPTRPPPTNYWPNAVLPGGLQLFWQKACEIRSALDNLPHRERQEFVQAKIRSLTGIAPGVVYADAVSQVRFPFSCRNQPRLCSSPPHDSHARRPSTSLLRRRGGPGGGSPAAPPIPAQPASSPPPCPASAPPPGPPGSRPGAPDPLGPMPLNAGPCRPRSCHCCDGGTRPATVVVQLSYI